MCLSTAEGSSKEPEAQLKDQRVWSVAECGKVFANSCAGLREQFQVSTATMLSLFNFKPLITGHVSGFLRSFLNWPNIFCIII